MFQKQMILEALLRGENSKEYCFRTACIKPPELKRREMEEDPGE
jgi:hypothetical protein